MAQNVAPTQPNSGIPLVTKDGRLTQPGVEMLDQMWRQIVAGFAIVPCQATGTNLVTLRPMLHREGARTYGDHMAFAAVAEATSTGSVTAKVTDVRRDLATVKVFKDGGATQAGSGDVIADRLYLWIYVAALDSGNGGLVLK